MIISRLVNAPRDLVFKAITDPNHVKHWWGPDGFTNTIHEMDVRPGGVWRFMMHGPDGVDYPNKIVFLEVERPARLVYEHSSDTDTADDPHRFMTTITLAEQDGKTLVTLRAVFGTAEQLEQSRKFGAVEGGHQTLARLDRYLSEHPVL
jgi:uncharacterized protein YndB with AHSA1/START domain